MKDINAILHSEYIIDGVRMDATPAQMLSECIPYGKNDSFNSGDYPPIVDEPADLAPGTVRYSSNDIYKYLDLIVKSSGKRNVPPEFSGSFTRLAIARMLLETLWKEGHFSLEDLGARISWEWDCSRVGNMAAFYFSVEAASEYLFDLGIKLEGYSISGSKDGNRIFLDDMILKYSPSKEEPDKMPDDDITVPEDTPYADESCAEFHDTVCSEQKLQDGRKCPEEIIPERKSWLIYIPFDTCQFKLGGSMLSDVAGSNGDNAPEIKDPDYFIDCFEVLRELVEDGVVVSGATVSGGGLMTAAERMCRKTGCSLDIKGLETAYNEHDTVRILFGETPGVIIQIQDSDYDYVDSQLLLQDVAYYPLGHPDPEHTGVSVTEAGRPDVFSILEALLNSPTASEGED